VRTWKTGFGGYGDDHDRAGEGDPGVGCVAEQSGGDGQDTGEKHRHPGAEAVAAHGERGLVMRVIPRAIGSPDMFGTEPGKCGERDQHEQIDPPGVECEPYPPWNEDAEYDV